MRWRQQTAQHGQPHLQPGAGRQVCTRQAGASPGAALNEVRASSQPPLLLTHSPTFLPIIPREALFSGPPLVSVAHQGHWDTGRDDRAGAEPGLSEVEALGVPPEPRCPPPASPSCSAGTRNEVPLSQRGNFLIIQATILGVSLCRRRSNSA